MSLDNTIFADAGSWSERDFWAVCGPRAQQDWLEFWLMRRAKRVTLLLVLGDDGACQI